jgi:hypothetical protein
MAVFHHATGILEEPTSVLLSTTGVVDVYTAAIPEIATVIGVIIVNADASSRQVSVWWTEGSTDHLIFTGEVGAMETVADAVQVPVRLIGKLGRKIKAQASASNVVTLTLITTFTSAL